METLFQRVMKEELERIIQSHQSFNHLQHEEVTMKLIFSKPLPSAIYTGSEIQDTEGNPLEVVVVRTSPTGETIPTVSLPSSLNLQVVVLPGDFRDNKDVDWISTEFDRSIVKERRESRPLIVGNVNFTMRDGVASIYNLSFTDNSSWVRSGKFRIGVRVAPGSYTGERIKEAITEPFRVKNRIMESCKKHYPPFLTDEVWRLEKITKDGRFHKKLSQHRIESVHDFLKLSTVDPERLRQILGPGMSDSMWECTLGHAKTCVLGDKIYVFRAPQCTIFLDPICQVVRAVFGTTTYTFQDLNEAQKAHVHELVVEAYGTSESLEEISEDDTAMVQS